MFAIEWWALPVMLEALLVICCLIVGNIDVPGAGLAAAALFIAGSLVIGFLALGCYACSH